MEYINTLSKVENLNNIQNLDTNIKEIINIYNDLTF